MWHGPKLNTPVQKCSDLAKRIQALAFEGWELPTAGQLNNFCPQVRSLPQLCRSTTVKWLLECHSFQRGVSKFVLF